MLNLSIPESVKGLRDRVLRFIEQDVYPVEKELTEDKVGSRRGEIMKGLWTKLNRKVCGPWGILKK